jgi:hypothetical protein
MDTDCNLSQGPFFSKVLALASLAATLGLTADKKYKLPVSLSPLPSYSPNAVTAE